MLSGKPIQVQVKTLGQPTVNDIIKVLDLSQRSPGRPVVLNWIVEAAGKIYDLMATVPAAQRGLGGARQEHRSVPELVLTVKTAPTAKETVLWTHVSGDAELIFHMLHNEMNSGGQAAKSSFFGFSDAEVVSGTYATIQMNTGGHPVVRNQSPSQAAQTAQAAAGMKLEGTLAEVDLSNLIQSIAMCKMTGCMKVQSKEAAASLFLDKGNLIHAFIVHSTAISALGAEVEGDEAVLETLLMEQGSFQFQPYLSAAGAQTVSKPLENYLLEGAAFRDHYAQLLNIGFSLDTCFRRAHESIEPEVFMKRLEESIPADLKVQLALYEAFDGKMKFKEVLRKHPMKRIDWVPAVYGLLSCCLIEVVEPVAQVNEQRCTKESIESLLSMSNHFMMRRETEIMLFPVWLRFVEQELARRADKPDAMSVACFEVLLNTPDGIGVPSQPEQKEMGQRIREVLPKYAQLAHYFDSQFALLLPLQDSATSCHAAKLVMDVIAKMKFEGVKDASDVKVCFGIAVVPEAGKNLLDLIKSLDDAMGVCKATDASIYTYKKKVQVAR
jgi:hypothetical protein